MSFESKLKFYTDTFNKSLSNYLDSVKKGVPPTLYEAVKYSVSDGGKRVRPVLCYAVSDMLGVDFSQIEYYAIAVELIHSYSLVHDDLPCMDNDDYRRGKYSTHKKYGEATGVLVGDALLNLAIETSLKKSHYTDNDISALKILFYCSGFNGMIKGQMLDLENENRSDISEETMNEIFINKTSRLIEAPILIASLMADKLYFEQLNEYGTLLGILFQLTDDILDVESNLQVLGKTPNKDAESGKLSAVKVYGLDGAKNKAEEIYLTCKEILSDIPNSDFLSEFTDKIYNRKF